MPRGTVVLVEDEEVQRLVAQAALEELGAAHDLVVRTAADIEEARRVIAAAGPGPILVLADAVLPDGDGGRVLDGLQDTPEREGVLLTAGAAGRRDAGPEVLTKPADLDGLRGLLAGRVEAWLARLP